MVPSNSSESLGNNTNFIDCNSYNLPDIFSFFNHINRAHKIILLAECCLLFFNYTLFILNLRNIIRNQPKNMVTKSLIVCAIYPIVVTASTMSSFIPKAYFFCDTISHLSFSFMICAYSFFCLCLEYSGGESAFIKANEEEVYSMRTPPCCCCCLCIHNTLITKNRFTITRCLVLQLVVVQSAIFVVLNLMHAEDQHFFDATIPYFVPFMVGSIIIGVWGLNITVRMIAPIVPDIKLMKKYFSFQVVLLLLKVQPFLVKAAVIVLSEQCHYPFTVFVQKNLIAQFLLTIEMTLLSICALFLYRTPQRE